MAFLQLYHKCKKTDAKMRALEKELKRCAKRKELFDAKLQAELDKHSGESHDSLLAQQKRAVVIERAGIKPTIDDAWEMYTRCSPATRCYTCGDDVNASSYDDWYRCIFDRNGPHQYCGECFDARDDDLMIKLAEQLKAAYLVKKSARPYMAGHQIACDT